MLLLRCALGLFLMNYIVCQEPFVPSRKDFCPAKCGLPTITLGGTEYYIHTSSKVTWFEAYKMCTANDMKLLSIETEVENNMVKRGIATSVHDTQFWTSGNDIESEGAWIWRSTGQPVTFTDWELNQPATQQDGVEHCMFIGNVGPKLTALWHDAPCTRNFFFVCEKPK